MNGTRRADIERGVRVAIVQKQDQRTGRLTEGVVRDILTKSATHPHGIKVRLETGESRQSQAGVRLEVVERIDQRRPAHADAGSHDKS